MFSFVNQLSPTGKFEERYTFLNGATGNDKEILAVGLREAAVPLGNIGRDRERSSVELVDQKTVATLKGFSGRTNGICKIDGLLIDHQLLELERHLPLQKK